MRIVTKYLPTQKARALFLVAIMFVSVGVTNYVTADEITPSQQGYKAYEAQFTLFHSLRTWGLLFVLSGIVAMGAALMKKYYAGFFALMLMSMWWAGLFATSLALNGYSRIVPSILTWALIAVFLYNLASWPEMFSRQDVRDELTKREGNSG